MRTASWWHEDSAEAWLRHGEHLIGVMRAQLPADLELEGARVLDFGCGAGRVLRHIPDLVGPDGEAHGVDIDRASIDWLQIHGGPLVRAACVTETPGLPYPDGHFDLVYALSVFTHIVENWAGWLLELGRVLAPGGVLLATVIGPQTAAELGLRRGDGDGPAMYARGLGNTWDQGGPVVLHDAGWVGDHWGRAFAIVSHADRVTGEPWPHDIVVARPLADAVGVDELLAPGRDGAGEGRAWNAQLELLRTDALALRAAYEHRTHVHVDAANRGRAEIEARAAGRLVELSARYDELERARSAAASPAGRRLMRSVQTRLRG